MYCKTCGSLINDEAIICPKCGCETGKSVLKKDESSIGYAILGFLIPILGLILYLIWHSEYPLRAKSIGKGALISVIVSVTLYLLLLVVVGSAVDTYSYY